MCLVLTEMWHRFWFNYNVELYESCMDKETKSQLLRKLEYHDQKQKVM